MGTILVTNDMIDNYGITGDQLFADAAKFAPELRPSEIKGMADVLAEMMGVDPNYYLTSDADERNRFDVEQYLHGQKKLNKKDVYTVVDADAVGDDDREGKSDALENK